MDDESFWRMIGRLDWRFEGDDERVAEPAVDFLARESIQTIQGFLDTLAAKLFALDGRSWAKQSCAWWCDPDKLSADEFLYERCVVVANGREYYEAVLADPAKMPKDLEFEELLHIADAAYERAVGAPSELVPAISYETFANSDGWR